jgi:hypothetical protein
LGRWIPNLRMFSELWEGSRGFISQIEVIKKVVT